MYPQDSKITLHLFPSPSLIHPSLSSSCSFSLLVAESVSLSPSDEYISVNSEPTPVDERGRRYPLVYSVCVLSEHYAK